MHLESVIFLTYTASVVGMICNGTVNNIELPDDVTERANPFFVNTDTGETFYKYSTSVGIATEEDTNALEYISTYVPDTKGFLWLVSEKSRHVAKMTKAYLDQFQGDLPADSIGDEDYIFEESYFEQLLHQVRTHPDLLKEAQAWVIDMKQRLINTPLKAKRDLEERTLVRCGPSRCQSQRTCRSWASYCTTCYNFICYYLVTPIVDAC